jgi:hypothetical protein
MKYTFTLKNIDTDKIHKLYNLNITSNLTSNEQLQNNITKLSELTISSEKDDITSFIDDSKNNIYTTMIDIISKEIIPSRVDLKCFWCRNYFNWHPLSCPIKYNCSQVEKTYFSDITKDKYTIKENISKDKKTYFNNLIQQNKNDVEKNTFNIIDKDYFETDGIFCSFNCCLAFINENKNNSSYKHSKNLLKKIYYDIFGVYPNNLTPAPSWRLLKEYGGIYTIEEFRKTFNKVEYSEIYLLKNNLKLKMCGMVYQSKVNKL